MSTFAEIESAVRELSPAEQRELLRRLQATLPQQKRDLSLKEREEWMRQLDELRAANGAISAYTSEQIINELREERF